MRQRMFFDYYYHYYYFKNVAGGVRFSNYAKIFDDMCNSKIKVKKKDRFQILMTKRKRTVGVAYPNVKYTYAINIPICC